MIDDNYFNSLLSNLSSTTTTEQETETDNNPQQTFGQTGGYEVSSPYTTYDYSATPNYTEEQSYNTTSNNVFDPVQQQSISQMEVPTVTKMEAPVNLVKSRAKVVFETRMKVVMSVFMVIVACLLFITAFNFIQIGKIQSTFADKQIEINTLEKSISDSTATYNLVNNDEYLKNWAETNNFVATDETNTIYVKATELYEEAQAKEISSNWFNDFCDFLSRLFA